MMKYNYMLIFDNMWYTIVTRIALYLLVGSTAIELYAVVEFSSLR